MGRKNRGGKKGRGDDSDEEEEKPQATAPAGKGGAAKGAAAEEESKPQLSRKQKKQQKQQQKGKNQQDSDDDSDDDNNDNTMAMLLGGNKKNMAQYGSDSDEDDVPRPTKGGRGGKGGGRGGRGNQKPSAAALLVSDDSDDEESEQEEEKMPQPVSKKNQKANAVPDDDDDDVDEDLEPLEDDEEEEDDDDDDGGFGGMQFTSLAASSGKKKKKDKKEKKEKKEKKDKKHKKHKKDKKDSDSEGKSERSKEDVAVVVAAVAALEIQKAPAAAVVPKQKTKLELQIEAAMKKKQDAAAVKKGGEAPKKVVAAIPETPSQLAEDMEHESEEKEADESELMYGHADDVVWTDKSHAMKQAEDDEKNRTDGPDPLMYDEDGKKRSNKERKKLIKEREAAARLAEYEVTAAKASAEGAQFACSQTAVNEKDPQWENALDISIPNFSISAAGKILFKDAALTIGHGRRYGLVGANGRGKSTLLKLIASRELKLPPRIDFLYVEQEVVADDTPAVDAVLKADKVGWDLMMEEKILMKKVDAGDESAATIERLEVVLDELTQMGAASNEAKARRILHGLGFAVDMQTKPTKMFSGGWRMRISLARALFVEPTLLMLDEPTNHLDLNAVIWLDEYLQKWKKTLLIVSHDQDFLNSVCQEILHIEDLKLASYKGDYDTFKKAEKEKLKQNVKAWEKQEKRIRELKKGKTNQSKAQAIESVKRSAKQREAGARSQKKSNQAIATGTESAKIAELIKRPREYAVKLDFTEVPEIGRPVMEVNEVHFRYSPKHPIIFDKVDFGIDMDSRVCVVGPNGAGKSTLLKLLTGEVQATTGLVRRNPRLRMGVYNQHFVDRLPMGKTPIEHLRDRFEDLDYQSCRNRLGKYGLEGHAHEVVMRDLSGGQKARVVFVELSLQMPHILLLDEPTNNLDIETIDALIDAINEFNGGMVVVTHDQRLIEACEMNLWVVEKQGVTEWKAGFDDYKETILKQLEEEVEREAAVRRQKLEAGAAARAEKVARLAQKIKEK